VNAEEELGQIEGLLGKMGASESQAKVMAKQLVKRADQLAQERGNSRVEAMRELLELVAAGRAGESPPGFEGVSKGKGKISDDF